MAVERNTFSFKHLHALWCGKRSTMKYVTQYVIVTYIPRACPVLKKNYQKTATFMQPKEYLTLVRLKERHFQQDHRDRNRLFLV